MLTDNFEDLPSASVPNDECRCIFIHSFAGRGQLGRIRVGAKAIYLLRVTVEFISFGPQGMLDQIVLVRSYWVIQGLIHYTWIFLLFLLNLLRSLLFFVVSSYLLTLDFLHFGHEAEHLSTSLWIWRVEKDRIFRFGHFVKLFFSLRVEEKMEIGRSEGIEIVGKTSRRLKNTNDFLISPASYHIYHLIFHFYWADCVNIIAMYLSSRNLVKSIGQVMSGNDTSGLVFRSGDQKVTTVVPINPCDMIRVACKTLPQYKFPFSLFPNQKSTSIV